MPRRSPKILDRDTAETAKSVSAEQYASQRFSPLPFATEEERRNYVPPPPPTPLDEFYNLIYAKCVKGYRFTDNYYGIPWIEKGDIEDKGNGLYVLRFISPVEYAKEGYFGRVAQEVCQALHCDVHVFHKTKEDVYFGKIRMSYEDYVWVVQVGELDAAAREDGKPKVNEECQEEEEDHDNWTDDSTVDEIDERFAKAMEEFV